MFTRLTTAVLRYLQPDTCEFGNHSYGEWVETNSLGNPMIVGREKVKWRECDECGQSEVEFMDIEEFPFEVNLAEPVSRGTSHGLYDFKNCVVFADSLPAVSNHVERCLSEEDGQKLYVVKPSGDFRTVKMRADSPEKALQEYMRRTLMSGAEDWDSESVVVFEVGLEFVFSNVRLKEEYSDSDVEYTEYIRERKLYSEEELEELI